MTFRKAVKNDISAIAKLSAYSFADYPLFSWLQDAFSNRQEYLDFFYDLHLLIYKASMRKNTCLVGTIDDKIVTAALLEHPEHPKPTLLDYILAGGLSLYRHLNFKEVQHLFDISEKSLTACSKVQEPYWHMEMLVVDKSFQGNHLGSEMLEECVIPFISEQNGTLLTFTTNTEINRKFYLKNGFTEFDHMVIPKKGNLLENWSFKMAFKGIAGCY